MHGYFSKPSPTLTNCERSLKNSADTLYIQGKGSLRAELEAVMKTQDVLIRGGKRRKTRPRNAGVFTGKPWIKGAEIMFRPRV